MPTCAQCRQGFSVHPDETAFYAKMGVPEPTMCPACRRQRRLLFRNFFHLYHRTCDLTGKKIVSMYRKDAVFPVYEMHEWWGDKWDGLTYGKDVDFSRPFFEQVKTLHETVPRMSIVNSQSENTDYCNFSFQSRACYLIFGNVGNEDCAYGHIVWQSKDCYDCLYTYRNERCHECVDCVQCHSLTFSRDCDNCASSSFLVHCVGCTDCFGCVGLRNKKHCIFNEQHTEADYRAKLAELNPGHIRTVELAKQRVEALVGHEIVKCYHGFGCENVTGDYLYNCKNVHEGYDLKNCEDCRHCTTLDSFRDCQDCNFAASPAELSYNCLTAYGYRLIGCQCCMTDSSDLTYCDNCYGCNECFGCVGLKKKRYCILNKQYTKEQYEALVPKLIAHMRATKEWGEFYPVALSPFGYNETMAQTYFPLTKEQVLARGWAWQDETDETMPDHYMGPDTAVPDDIRDAEDSLSTAILRCAISRKPYRIIPQELTFYRSMQLPLPRLSPDQRLKDRFALRNPRRLWNRACAKCAKAIQTTYAPERPETVYCERCYLETL